MRGIAADLHRAAAGDKVSKAAVSKTVSMGTKVAERKTALSELQKRRPIRCVDPWRRASKDAWGSIHNPDPAGIIEGGGETPAP